MENAENWGTPAYEIVDDPRSKIKWFLRWKCWFYARDKAITEIRKEALE